MGLDIGGAISDDTSCLDLLLFPPRSLHHLLPISPTLLLPPPHCTNLPVLVGHGESTGAQQLVTCSSDLAPVNAFARAINDFMLLVPSSSSIQLT